MLSVLPPFTSLMLCLDLYHHKHQGVSCFNEENFVGFFSFPLCLLNVQVTVLHKDIFIQVRNVYRMNPLQNLLTLPFAITLFIVEQTASVL